MLRAKYFDPVNRVHIDYPPVTLPPALEGLNNFPSFPPGVTFSGTRYKTFEILASDKFTKSF